MAAITVSGRHALLVGYQPDEALRPSLANLFLSLPFAPSMPRLSFSRPLSKSPRLTPLQAEEREFIDGTLYLHARVSLRSPKLMGSWKNLGRMLLTSRTTLYLAILTRTSYMLLTLSTRIRTSISLSNIFFKTNNCHSNDHPKASRKIEFKTKFLKTLKNIFEKSGM